MFYVIGALFAIVVGVILLVNVIGGGGQANTSSQINTLVDEVNQIRSGVGGLGFHGSFAGVDNSLLEQTGIMPPELIGGAIGAGNDFSNFAGILYVLPMSNWGYPDSCFGVYFETVPRQACIAMLSQVASSCTVSSAFYANGWRNFSSPNQPLDPGTAAGYCSSATDAVLLSFND